MSEAAPSIATLSKDLALEKAGSIGRAVFHLDVRIVDEKMNDMPDRVRWVNWSCAAPTSCREYWNRPEATRRGLSGRLVPQRRPGPDG